MRRVHIKFRGVVITDAGGKPEMREGYDRALAESVLFYFQREKDLKYSKMKIC